MVRSEGVHHAPPADVLGGHVSYRHYQWISYGFGLRIWSRRQHAATVNWLKLWAEECQSQTCSDREVETKITRSRPPRQASGALMLEDGSETNCKPAGAPCPLFFGYLIYLQSSTFPDSLATGGQGCNAPTSAGPVVASGRSWPDTVLWEPANDQQSYV